MSTFPTRSRSGRTPRPRRGRLLRLVVAVIALALAFLLGIAFSRALDERPEPGADVTTVRTVSLASDEVTRTVTVTVTSP